MKVDQFEKNVTYQRIVELSRNLLVLIPRPINVTSEEYKTFWTTVLLYNHLYPFNFPSPHNKVGLLIRMLYSHIQLY